MLDPAAQAELHIASVVVHATPARAERVAAVVREIPAAEVHAVSPQGKLVVTMEAPTSDAMLAMIGHIQRTEGVLSVAIVYQCADTLDAMNEPLDLPSSPAAHQETVDVAHPALGPT